MAEDGPRGFNLDEIMQLTNLFSDDKQIGEGGFGRVYKVISPKGEAWAVNRSTRVRQENRFSFEREVTNYDPMHVCFFVFFVWFYFRTNKSKLPHRMSDKGTAHTP